ncbi:MAG: hypothetical protein KKB66_18505 [Alphaproteobacteria bacterium]|uniref:Uncharacterized protein n=1 Tax=viral metagenome TaxID=1070528 RepID=A0A6H1ZFJ7_9ZZZZ|nr:hypothetical protein [Alphaproteobacteria bacterium]MBU0803596.1 hypothetical protein [Alphaproteobacteria bacterium]MBU0873107.1 hypothetical protein [Alphaproteobacteria bacterium]MBU1402523.1 hypothetical protein [Alphaproteobacteria bacterium]MBU1593165.1 hypothetical protein [Alphaproteobacteria bacterium]
MNRRSILTGSAAALLAAPATVGADAAGISSLIETHKEAAARVDALVAFLNDLEEVDITPAGLQEAELSAAHDAASAAILAIVCAVPSSEAGARAKADYLIGLLTGERPHDVLDDGQLIALLNSIVEQH